MKTVCPSTLAFGRVKHAEFMRSLPTWTVIVSPETVAVVGGRKSECLTFGEAQPVSNEPAVRRKIVTNRFMCVVGLTMELTDAGPMMVALKPQRDPGVRCSDFVMRPVLS